MPNEYNSRMERRHQLKKSRGQKRVLWKRILFSLCAIFMLAAIACAIMVAVMIHDAPSLKASNLETPQSTLIYDQDEKPISTLFHEENRIKIDISDVPKKIKNAVISIEDRRFYEHHGIDFHRLAGAAVANIKNGWGSEGGSTITQQVIKRSVLTPKKTLERKVQEAWLALQLENKYSKDQILEMYLNNVYYGHGAYGIKTASKTYFDEDNLSKLNISQVALLAGLPNSPSADDPFKHPKRAKERRNIVLSAMATNNVISKQQAKQAKDKQISEILVKEENRQENSDSYNGFIDVVYEQLVNQKNVVSEKEFFQGGLKIYTTLDSKAQEKVYNLLRSEDIPYPDENFETGISLVDTKTGAIKAVGGGRNFESIRYTNYGANVQNQPGSTIKPILDYGPAIEYLNWPTSHMLKDEHYQYSDGTPINEWDNEYWGSITMRRALAWSRNIPALKAFQAAGKDKAKAFASGLGIHIDPIYESAAIGGFDGVTPLQIAEAYAAFGNGGTYHEPFSVKKVVFPNGKEWKPEPESNQAMHDYTAYMITDMLKTVITSGTGTQANIPGLPVAGKTGSTNIPQEIKDQYGLGDDGILDSWFAGYTTQYSLGIWTGYPSLKNKDGEVQYIRKDGSQDIAKQLFHSIMSGISNPNVSDFEKPSSVVSRASELYIQGTQPEKQYTEQADYEEDEKTPDKEEEEQDKDKANQEKNKEDQKKEENPDKDQTDEEKDKENQEQHDKPDENKTDEGKDKESQKKEQDKNQADEEKGTENPKQEDKPGKDEQQDKKNDQSNGNNDDKKKDVNTESNSEDNNP